MGDRRLLQIRRPARSTRSSTTAGCAPATSARLDPLGYITLSDRAKDVIKSGGEWISSVDLENALMGHPDVVEAAVVGIPDEKWQERPLATVVVREGATVTPEAAPGAPGRRPSRSGSCPTPGRSSTRCPRTSVGKFDKKVVRQGFAEGRYDVRRVSD